MISGGNYMTFNVRTFLLSTALSVGATALLAAGTHPVTSEKLSDNQTYTWRLLDEITSLDPQLNEDVDGSQFGRDMFEGRNLSHIVFATNTHSFVCVVDNLVCVGKININRVHKLNNGQKDQKTE